MILPHTLATAVLIKRDVSSGTFNISFSVPALFLFLIPKSPLPSQLFPEVLPCLGLLLRCVYSPTSSKSTITSKLSIFNVHLSTFDAYQNIDLQ